MQSHLQMQRSTPLISPPRSSTPLPCALLYQPLSRLYYQLKDDYCRELYVITSCIAINLRCRRSGNRGGCTLYALSAAQRDSIAGRGSLKKFTPVFLTRCLKCVRWMEKRTRNVEDQREAVNSSVFVIFLGNSQSRRVKFPSWCYVVKDKNKLNSIIL